MNEEKLEEKADHGRVVEEPATKVTGRPTQLAHKARAVKRTTVVVIAALILVNAVLALFMDVFGEHLGDVHMGWVASVSGFIALLVTFLQRLLLVEAWQPLLEKLGLGTGAEDEA